MIKPDEKSSNLYTTSKFVLLQKIFRLNDSEPCKEVNAFELKSKYSYVDVEHHEDQSNHDVN